MDDLNTLEGRQYRMAADLALLIHFAEFNNLHLKPLGADPDLLGTTLVVCDKHGRDRSPEDMAKIIDAWEAMGHTFTAPTFKF